MDGARGKAGAVAVAAHVGGEVDGDAAPRQLLGERLGGKQMSARAAGRQQYRCRLLRHFCTGPEGCMPTTSVSNGGFLRRATCGR